MFKPGRFVLLALLIVLGSPVPVLAQSPARGVLLVADRSLSDPNFIHAVILIIEHNSQGSLGVIINRPSSMSLADAVAELAPLGGHAHTLYHGGPVARQALNYLVTRRPSGAAMEIAEGIILGGTRSGLKALLENGIDAADLRTYGGYAGWGPGQLPAELDRGTWHVTPAQARDVFSAEPKSVWPRLINTLDPRGLLTLIPPSGDAM